MRGFALVITLGLVALLLVLVLSLTSLVKVDSTFTQTTLHQSAARQNALLALDIALAQLQKHAGPDTRVTATSEFVPSATQLHYTGVWNTANAASPTPVTWLVSGNEGANPLAVTPLNAANTALLVGPGTVGATQASDQVSAPLVDIKSDTVPGQPAGAPIGRYAWWVGDQGVKASVALADPTVGVMNFNYAPYKTSPELLSRIRQQIGLGAGPADLLANAIFEPRDTTGSPSNATLTTKTISSSQLAQFNKPGGTVGVATLQKNFYAWSPTNYAVLANTKLGGLRQDLSLKPDLLGRAFVEWTNYDPLTGGYMENPAAPRTPTPLQPYSSDPVRRRYPIKTSVVDKGIEHRVAPVLSFFGLSFSLRNDTSNNSPTKLQASVRCVVELWNPYSAALVPEDLEILVSGLPEVAVQSAPGGIQRTVNLQDVFKASDATIKFTLKFTPNNQDPDQSSWLPGRVYCWSAESRTGDPGNAGYSTSFYVRDATLGVGGVVRDAGAAIGPNTVSGKQQFRQCTVSTRTILNVELRRVSDHRTIAQFNSLRFDSFTTDATRNKVGASASDFAFVFRLPERSELPTGETDLWLQAPGRDVREFPFPAANRSGYIAPGGQAPNPALLVTAGQSGFPASYPQLLLDRYTNVAGKNYSEDAPVFELPRAPLLSVGSLQHLHIVGQRPFAVGNSWGGALNQQFDQYFFSGLASGNGWNDVALPLPNPLLAVLSRKPDGTATTATDINGAPRAADGFSSKHLLQTGAFNLNSTAIEAWVAVLRAVRFSTATKFAYAKLDPLTGTTAKATGDATTNLVDPLLTNSGVAAFPRFAQSAQETFQSDDGFVQSEPAIPSTGLVNNTSLFRRGLRILSASQVSTLAGKVAGLMQKKLRASGPFLTLEDFLTSSPFFADSTGKQVSLLEQAIDDAKLNTKAEMGLVNTAAEFSSQWLMQGDIMTALAPVLFPRSDAFTIRAYGEAVNPALAPTDAGYITGRAWCDALVQRLPEYHDPADSPETIPASLSSTNQTFGRRFRIISLRWLSTSDL